MTTKFVAETTIEKEGAAESAVSPGHMHRPAHSALDTESVAAHDEVLHEAALRDSALRAPR